MSELAEEVKDLIALQQEGGYWDFKREWYTRKPDMLHDIICMANNLENRDAYIIIGVDQEVGFEVFDVLEDKNRRNTEQIVDFLRGKDFAGGIRPTVYTRQVRLRGKTIDVIVIKNDRNTPYYLKSKYEDVRANHVYTRVMDTNTPKDASADRIHIESLWKKSFHLDEGPLERVMHYLADRDSWDHSPIESCSIRYYRYYPEYTIEKVDRSDLDGYEYYLFNQPDSRPHWYDVNIRFHQTIIASIGGVALDGGRYFTATPCNGFISFNRSAMEADVYYKYFIEGSLEQIVHNHYFDSGSSQANFARDRFLRCILVFRDETEKIEFEAYVESRKNRFEQVVEKVNKEQYLPHFPEIEGYRTKGFTEQYINMQALLQMFNLFRDYESLDK